MLRLKWTTFMFTLLNWHCTSTNIQKELCSGVEMPVQLGFGWGLIFFFFSLGSCVTLLELLLLISHPAVHNIQIFHYSAQLVKKKKNTVPILVLHIFHCCMKGVKTEGGQRKQERNRQNSISRAVCVKYRVDIQKSVWVSEFLGRRSKVSLSLVKENSNDKR